MDEQATALEQFEAAYIVAWPQVLRFALAWTNDREEALDAAQETFRRIWERRHQYDFSTPIAPLALTIERRLLVDRGRRLARRARAIMRAGVAQPAWTPTTSDGWLDLQKQFATLTPLERVAIVGLAYEGYTSDELAELLGSTAGAVRAAASRGRQKLVLDR